MYAAIAEKHIPRGYRKNIWNNIRENLYQENIDENEEMVVYLLFRLDETKYEKNI